MPFGLRSRVRGRLKQLRKAISSRKNLRANRLIRAKREAEDLLDTEKLFRFDGATFLRLARNRAGKSAGEVQPQRAQVIGKEIKYPSFHQVRPRSEIEEIEKRVLKESLARRKQEARRLKKLRKNKHK